MPCSECRESGHNIKTCPYKAGANASGSRASSSRSARHCSVCGDTTHDKRYHDRAPTAPLRPPSAPSSPGSRASSSRSVRHCSVCGDTTHDKRYHNNRAPSPPRRPPPAPTPSVQRCGVCRRAGHNRRTCPFGNEGAAETPTPTRIRHCSECNSTDHDRRTCPRAGARADVRDTQGGSSSSGVGRGRGVRHCSECRETGHDKRTCPKSADGGSKFPGRVRHCSICRNTTHDKRTCPKRGVEPRAPQDNGPGSGSEEYETTSESECVTDDDEEGDSASGGWRCNNGKGSGCYRNNSSGFRTDTSPPDSTTSWVTEEAPSPRPTTVVEQRTRAAAGKSPSELADYFGGIVPSNELRYTGRQLGQGSFGNVVLADIRGTPVAVKKLRAQSITSNHREGFRKEGAMLAGLRHPGIVQLIGVCMEPELALVMEHMSKGSLWDVIHKQGQKLERSEKLAIVRDVASGLSYLHSQKIIHRDIKSSNVLLDSRLRAKISDFGHARTRNHSASTLTNHVGTILYMAPEIMRGEPYSEKADVYSFSLLVYEVLTESQPFEDILEKEGMGIMALQVQIKDRGLRPSFPASVRLSAAAKSWISKCWDNDPERRPTMGSIVRNLGDFPISAIFT